MAAYQPSTERRHGAVARVTPPRPAPPRPVPPRPAEQRSADFNARLDDLSNAARKGPWLELEDAPTAAPRGGVGIVGVIFAVILVVGVVVASLRQRPVDEMAAEPPVGAAAVSKPDQQCAARLDTIMDAVVAYKAAHGEPPATLAALYPTFLHTSLTSGTVPHYQVLGDRISLSCPHETPATSR